MSGTRLHPPPRLETITRSAKRPVVARKDRRCCLGMPRRRGAPSLNAPRSPVGGGEERSRSDATRLLLTDGAPAGVCAQQPATPPPRAPPPRVTSTRPAHTPASSGHAAGLLPGLLRAPRWRCRREGGGRGGVSCTPACELAAGTGPARPSAGVAASSVVDHGGKRNGGGHGGDGSREVARGVAPSTQTGVRGGEGWGRWVGVAAQLMRKNAPPTSTSSTGRRFGGRKTISYTQPRRCWTWPHGTQ